MARVLVVGRVADREQRRTGFPELRTSSFVTALRTAGHQVAVAGLVPAGCIHQGSCIAGSTLVEEEGPGWLEALARVAPDAQLVVGAGPYNASRAACLVADERPVFADLPGDPFAEVQAAVLERGQPDWERQAGAVAATLPVLVRADHFSVVSQAQRLLLLGQLGMVGRLASPDSLDLVSVVPVAWHFGLPPQSQRLPSTDAPLTVALLGSANAWLDIETMTRALDLAHAASAQLRVLLIGAPPAASRAAGFQPEEREQPGWQILTEWADHRSWVDMSGRLTPDALGQRLSQAHVGLVLDRPGLEPETGSRTRVLFLLHQGLQVVATTRTELCQDLSALGLLKAVPCGDPQAVAQALLSLQDVRTAEGSPAAGSPAAGSPAAGSPAAGSPAAGSPAAESPAAESPAAEILAERYSNARCNRALLDFAAQPRRRPPGPSAVDALARDHARLRDELTQVYRSPTWRLLGRLHRLIAKKPA